MNTRTDYSGQLTSCICAKYQLLELSREQIAERIKKTRSIQRRLDLKCKSTKGHHLFQCRFCMQLWQLSSAWNWGGQDYLFKVPDIEIPEWIESPYMSPADMMIYSASMKIYFEKNRLTDSNNLCKIENCVQNALLNNVLCKVHFIESLQKFGLLPQPPAGRLFDPYTLSI